jgi:thymidylate kinase
LWVVVLGPDGAGKSSVITEIGDGVAAGFAGCDSYHLTALNLHGRQGAKANCDPHGKAERSFLVTLFKLAYLFLLNWVGYLVAVLPKVESGRLVLFDRYFLDCLVDSRRYRIPVSCRWLARLVAKWVPEPDLYLVLDAPASVLRIRKQEVSEIEAERQRWEYRRLADNLANAMIVCADQPRELMLEEVTKRIIEAHLSLRQRILKTA